MLFTIWRAILHSSVGTPNGRHFWFGLGIYTLRNLIDPGRSLKIQFTPLLIWWIRPADKPNHQLGFTWFIALRRKLTEERRQAHAMVQKSSYLPSSFAFRIRIIWWPMYRFSLWLAFLSKVRRAGNLCLIPILSSIVLNSLVSTLTLETDGILFQGDLRILPVNFL